MNSIDEGIYSGTEIEDVRVRKGKNGETRIWVFFKKEDKKGNQISIFAEVIRNGNKWRSNT